VSQAEIDLARYMQDEAGRISGIGQSLASPADAASGRMGVAAIIAECLRSPPEPEDAEAMADRIIAALDTAARAEPARQYAVHDVVQIAPTVDGFGGGFLLVTEVLTWGVRGFVQGPVGGRQHVQVDFGRVEHTGGRAVWAPPAAADGEGR
jgi:hypothetical protein